MLELDFSNLITTYKLLPIGWKIGVPVIITAVIALVLLFNAVILWWAAWHAGDEEFSFLRSLGIAALHLVAFVPVSWLVLKYFILPNLLSWGPKQTFWIANATMHVLDLALLVSLLLLLGRMSLRVSLFTWLARFVIDAHVRLLLVGIIFLGAHLMGETIATIPLALTGVVCLLAALAGPGLCSFAELAGAERLSMLRSLAIGWAELVVLALLSYYGVGWVVSIATAWDEGQMALFLGGLILALSFATISVGVWKLGGATPGIGMLTWLFRLPVHLLILGLALKEPTVVLLPSLLGFSALLLAAGVRMTGEETFTFTQGLLIILPAAVVLAIVNWLLMKYVIVPNILEWGFVRSSLIAGGIVLVTHFGLVVAGLVFLWRLPPVRAMLSWVYSFVLHLHISTLLFGLIFVGASVYSSTQSLGPNWPLPPGTPLMTIGVICLLVTLASPILWMAGALAGAEKLSLPQGLPIAWAELLVFVPLYFLGLSAVEKLAPALEAWQQMAIVIGAIVIAGLVPIVIAIRFVADASIGCGVLTCLLRLPLFVLIAALVSGLEFIGLSINQALGQPGGQVVLQRIALILEAVLGAGLMLFFASSANRPSAIARRLA